MPFKMFIHGLESSNQGTKSVFFREKYPDMVIPNFPGTLDERMKKLEGILQHQSDIRLVGSSFGGLMAAIFAMENETRVDRLVLLAPAIHLMDFADYQIKTLDIPVRLYHGRQDEVIPLEDVEAVANRVFRNLSFHAVDDDHFLHQTFKTLDWDHLLGE
ncbi:YqiA/YcfP family alpha/beta fold hydrolase [Thermodesulfobacteriota bacterium]